MVLTKTIYNIVIFTLFLCTFEKYNEQDNFDCLNLVARRNNNSCCRVKKKELRNIKTKLPKRVLFDTPISARSRLI